ncbi:hypothetical protein JIN85_02530 [Luteolibacter pohnpeiensis]|uniref:Uncharacterized protein n=1 Tax=Luteolibacter pohnpeiensis TaxID=454153 RepID=A0A934VTA0_9BACT|nr:hypothetical protein [Luteolibacter pohnpeiensis]MBK1881272.1 hypothetical protein [Luteolibacter pohnpeiensis]
MPRKTKSFLQGGLGCLLFFFILAGLALALGGRVRADLPGVLALFVIGGLLGLLANWFYQKGKKDQNPD